MYFLGTLKVLYISQTYLFEKRYSYTCLQFLNVPIATQSLS
jgi:hypothetical protein